MAINHAGFCMRVHFCFTGEAEQIAGAFVRKAARHGTIIVQPLWSLETLSLEANTEAFPHFLQTKSCVFSSGNNLRPFSADAFPHWTSNRKAKKHEGTS